MDECTKLLTEIVSESGIMDGLSKKNGLFANLYVLIIFLPILHRYFSHNFIIEAKYQKESDRSSEQSRLQDLRLGVE